MKNAIIFGATSEIAQATGRILAANDNYTLYLVGRDEDRLKAVADDFGIRGHGIVKYRAVDFSDLNALKSVYSDAVESLGTLNLVLVAHGMLPNQALCEENMELVNELINVNLLSAIAILEEGARQLQGSEHATLAAITSVAGDRGRKTNCFYGMSKAALSTYLQGLRQRLASSGINVLDIKPGFVDTPMTAQVKKRRLFAPADRVAFDIAKKIRNRRTTLYTPWFWRYIMWVIRMIPEPIFKRLSF